MVALQLMRLDKPVGIFLLWWPTAWALWIAYSNHVPPLTLIWFGLGTVLMRSAGCVINDIADRRVDLHVKRTAARPLTSGKIDLLQAWVIFCGLLVLALLVLLQLPSACFYYAILSLLLCGIYPFCKRFISTPQTILALAFSMGMPMVFVAATHPFDRSLGLLLLINFAWVLAYDTLYACVDRADDQKIGIGSTALYWGERSNQWVITLFCLIQVLWLILAWQQHFSSLFLVGWSLGSINLFRQGNLFLADQYFQAFKLNAWYGFWMWVGIVLALIPL